MNELLDNTFKIVEKEKNEEKEKNKHQKTIDEIMLNNQETKINCLLKNEEKNSRFEFKNNRFRKRKRKL